MQQQFPSVMEHSFSRVPQARLPRSSFKRPFRHVTTIDEDYLYPLFTDEILPGDTFVGDFNAIARMITPLTPFMDNLYLDCFFFFCPNRIVQDNWVKLQGERDNPADSIDYSTPYITTTAGTGVANETLWDYLGIPTQVPDLRVDTHLHRMYNKIWNDWFRDQNLQDSVTVDVDDGPDTLADYVLLKRNKSHDYFTSCLPSPQKGTGIDLPLGTSAPIATDASAASSVTVKSTAQSDAQKFLTPSTYTVLSSNGLGDDSQSLYADLSDASAPTIYSLYEAFALQELLQMDARGGTRYFEILRAHFGVTSPDSRLQRPEYLGGHSFRVNVDPLPQTSETNTTELGTLAAVATAVINGFRITKSFVEHGHVIGLFNVRADLTYQQGLHRSFSRRTRYDYYMPALANLGEQAVLNKEIYAQGTSADEDTFGYQERWSEYRYGKSMITGKMRSNDAQSLDVWHLSEEFASLPALNSAFIQQNTPIDRVTAVTNEPAFKVDIAARVNHVRVMPTYSIPMLGNRF
jgi:hypothetical protein